MPDAPYHFCRHHPYFFRYHPIFVIIRPILLPPLLAARGGRYTTGLQCDCRHRLMTSPLLVMTSLLLVVVLITEVVMRVHISCSDE